MTGKTGGSFSGPTKERTELETYLADAELLPLDDVYAELQAVEAEMIEVLDSAGGEVVEETDGPADEESEASSAQTTTPSSTSSTPSSTTSTTGPETTTTTADGSAEPAPAEEPPAP